MLSYQAIALSHFGHRERGATTDSRSGHRVMQTFRKDPTHSPSNPATTQITYSGIRLQEVSSYRRIAAAAATFSDSARPRSGTETSRSTDRLTPSESPAPSLPTTSAARPGGSASSGSPAMSAPSNMKPDPFNQSRATLHSSWS